MFDRLRWLGAVLIGILLVGSSDALGAWPECARVEETGCYRGMFYKCQQLNESTLGFIGTGQTCPPANCAESEKALAAQFAAWNNQCESINNNSRPLFYNFCVDERVRLNTANRALVKACRR